MPQPKKAPRFGGTPAHHNLIMSNLATELIRHGRIRTTLAKAKGVQPLAERMVTLGKRGDLHARRQAIRVIRDRDVVHKLFADVGPAFAERDGGYTRLLKLGPRKGDAAPMALIELVEGVSVAGVGELEQAPRRRWSLRRRRGASSSQQVRERDEQIAAGADRVPAAPIGPEEGETLDADQLEQARIEADETGADPAEVERRLASEEAGEVELDEDDEAEGDGAEGDDGGGARARDEADEPGAVAAGETDQPGEDDDQA